IEAAVLEQNDVAGLERRVPCAAIDPVADERYLAAEQLAQSHGDRSERIGGAELTFDRPAQMRCHHHGAAARERVATARYRRADHCRDAADQHSRAECKREPAMLAVGFANGRRVRGKRVHGTGHLALMSATVVSSIRFENPHSLSYQLDTLTSRPDTLVSVAS